MQSVAIIGVGLIGGSFGLALRKAGFSGTITGVSSKPAIAEALAVGAIDREAPLADAVANADLIYLAQPVSQILETLTKLDPFLQPGALVTDAGSTKSEITKQGTKHIKRATFLGGHPMAGKEQRGAAASEATLFERRTYFVCPDNPEVMALPAVRAFVPWIEKIGANMSVLDPATHDRLVAFTSHLPQLASTALASMLAGTLNMEQAHVAAGSGLTDMTRLALSSHGLWADIIATNTKAIDQALSQYIDQLVEMRKRIASSGLESDFSAASELAQAIRKR